MNEEQPDTSRASVPGDVLPAGSTPGAERGLLARGAVQTRARAKAAAAGAGRVAQHAAPAGALAELAAELARPVDQVRASEAQHAVGAAGSTAVMDRMLQGTAAARAADLGRAAASLRSSGAVGYLERMDAMARATALTTASMTATLSGLAEQATRSLTSSEATAPWLTAVTSAAMTEAGQAVPRSAWDALATLRTGAAFDSAASAAARSTVLRAGATALEPAGRAAATALTQPYPLPSSGLEEALRAAGSLASGHVPASSGSAEALRAARSLASASPTVDLLEGLAGTMAAGRWREQPRAQRTAAEALAGLRSPWATGAYTTDLLSSAASSWGEENRTEALLRTVGSWTTSASSTASVTKDLLHPGPPAIPDDLRPAEDEAADAQGGSSDFDAADQGEVRAADRADRLIAERVQQILTDDALLRQFERVHGLNGEQDPVAGEVHRRAQVLRTLHRLRTSRVARITAVSGLLWVHGNVPEVYEVTAEWVEFVCLLSWIATRGRRQR